MNFLIDGLFSGWEDNACIFLHLPNGQALTRSDFTNLSSQLALRIVALGVRPGYRVAAQIKKSPEALALYIACVRAGAIFLPLNIAYTPTEISYFLDDATPSLFVCDESLQNTSGAIAHKKSIPVSLLNGDGSGDITDNINLMETSIFKNVIRNKEDPASILYTSGTTGKPKGAILSHNNLLSNARTLAKIWHFDKNDVLLHGLPIFHVHGLFTASNTMIFSGASMLFLPRFDVAEVCRLLPKATAMMGVPTHYTRLLAYDEFTRDKTTHMRLFISGSAPLLPETHIAFKNRTGHQILERYGMTETGMNTSNPYKGERRIGAVGFPLPEVNIRIVHKETGRVLPNGKIGSIEVKGDNVFGNYWNKAEQTAQAFRDDGYFITGDIGTFDDDGYLCIVGRTQDIIISGGLNVYPKEVEAIINKLPDVLESAVIGVPHPDFGECVITVIVAQAGHNLSPTNIIAKLSKDLAKFKIPKKIFIEDSLPRNTMGKVQKNILVNKHRLCFS